MRVLIVKTSSIGDVIHTLPALTDAVQRVPGVVFDWAVEAGFQEIPGWHEAVDRTIVVGLRRWRRSPLRGDRRQEMRDALRDLRRWRYDAVIDAQGLYKSALVALLARGARHGFDYGSAREPAASFAYRHGHRIGREQHAIARTRALFAAALGYDLPDSPPNYGLRRSDFAATGEAGPNLAFLHGTTWPTKLWSVARWRGLAAQATQAGHAVNLPWHGPEDRDRAEAISVGLDNVQPVETPTLRAAAGVIAAARGVVAVDTGLGHLAAALGVPTLSLYGPTSPDRVGTRGEGQGHFVSQRACAPCRSRACPYVDVMRTPPPCLSEMTEDQVWGQLRALIDPPVNLRRAAQ